MDAMDTDISLLRRQQMILEREIREMCENATDAELSSISHVSVDHEDGQDIAEGAGEHSRQQQRERSIRSDSATSAPHARHAQATTHKEITDASITLSCAVGRLRPAHVRRIQDISNRQSRTLEKLRKAGRETNENEREGNVATTYDEEAANDVEESVRQVTELVREHERNRVRSKSQSNLNLALYDHTFRDLNARQREHKKLAEAAQQRYRELMRRSASQARRRKSAAAAAGGGSTTLVEPFSFDAREREKPKRIRDKRNEEDRRKREKELEDVLNYRFAASRVPASTFVRKYDLMVEEWCARKEALQMLAADRARKMQEEAEFVAERAQEMKRTREDVFGIQHRAHSSCVPDTKSFGKSTFRAREIPAEVKMNLWPAMEEYERQRSARIKERAVELLLDCNYNGRLVRPLNDVRRTENPQASYFVPTGSPSVYRQQQQFPIVSPLPNAPNAAALPLSAPPATEFNPVSAQYSVMRPIATAISPLPPLPVQPLSTMPLSFPPPRAAPLCSSQSPQLPQGAMTSTPNQGPYDLEVVAAGTQPHDASLDAYLRRNVEMQRAVSPPPGLNRECTFQPSIHKEIPDFDYLWAKEKKELADRRSQKPATKPVEFRAMRRHHYDAMGDVSPSASGDGTGRTPSVGRNASKRAQMIRTEENLIHRKHRQNMMRQRQRHRSATPDGRRHTLPCASDVRKGKHPQGGDGGGSQVSEGMVSHEQPQKAPHGTRAHALRTEAILQRYLRGSEYDVDARQAKEEESARLQRQKELQLRLKQYIKGNPSREFQQAVEERVAQLRQEAKDSDKIAHERLKEMQERVAALPPLFAEQEGLNDMAHARAEAEQQILDLLKESGLNNDTLAAMLKVHGDDGMAAADEGAASAVAGDVDSAAKPSTGAGATTTTTSASVPGAAGAAAVGDSQSISGPRELEATMVQRPDVGNTTTQSEINYTHGSSADYTFTYGKYDNDFEDESSDDSAKNKSNAAATGTGAGARKKSSSSSSSSSSAPSSSTFESESDDNSSSSSASSP